MNREPEQREAMQAEGPETATLRLLAGQAPRDGCEGLERRVLARLREAGDGPSAWWSAWQPLAAGAACLVALLAWGVHAGLPRPTAGRSASHQAAQSATRPDAAPAETRAPGSFGTAGSMRVPPTLKPLHVPVPPRRGNAQAKTGTQAAKLKTQPGTQSGTRPKTQPGTQAKTPPAQTADNPATQNQ